MGKKATTNKTQNDPPVRSIMDPNWQPEVTGLPTMQGVLRTAKEQERKQNAADKASSVTKTIGIKDKEGNTRFAANPNFGKAPEQIKAERSAQISYDKRLKYLEENPHKWNLQRDYLGMGIPQKGLDPSYPEFDILTTLVAPELRLFSGLTKSGKIGNFISSNLAPGGFGLGTRLFRPGIALKPLTPVPQGPTWVSGLPSYTPVSPETQAREAISEVADALNRLPSPDSNVFQNIFNTTVERRGMTGNMSQVEIDAMWNDIRNRYTNYDWNQVVQASPSPNPTGWETLQSGIDNAVTQRYQSYLTPTPSPVVNAVKNRSGYTREELLDMAKDEATKDKVSKLTDSELRLTVLKPDGDVVRYHSDPVDLTKGGTNQMDPISEQQFVDEFNANLDYLNDVIIPKHNKTGVEYRVKKLEYEGGSNRGKLLFHTPSMETPNSAGTVSWGVDISPGNFRGEVEDIASTQYMTSMPGLGMRNTSSSVFSDRTARRGSGAYDSLNEYLKTFDLGRVKAGFNTQTNSSLGLWDQAVKRGKAYGFYDREGVIHGIMKKYGGMVNKYGSGEMIKRADGSYSRRGLWDNIRANRGSGNEPTEEMLEQERKIRAAEKNEYGSHITKKYRSSAPRVSYTEPSNMASGPFTQRGITFANGGPTLPREEGYYDFNEVPEKPMFYNMERAEQLYTPDETGHWPSVDYETGEWLKSKEHPTAWMEYLHGYTLNPQQALNYNVRTNPEGYFGENTLQYTPIVKSLSKKENGGKISKKTQREINKRLPASTGEYPVVPKSELILRDNILGPVDESGLPIPGDWIDEDIYFKDLPPVQWLDDMYNEQLNMPVYSPPMMMANGSYITDDPKKPKLIKLGLGESAGVEPMGMPSASETTSTVWDELANLQKPLSMVSEVQAEPDSMEQWIPIQRTYLTDSIPANTVNPEDFYVELQKNIASEEPSYRPAYSPLVEKNMLTFFKDDDSWNLGEMGITPSAGKVDRKIALGVSEVPNIFRPTGQQCVDSSGNLVDECASGLQLALDYGGVQGRKEMGIKGDAWTMGQNIIDAGGQRIYGLTQGSDITGIRNNRQVRDLLLTEKRKLNTSNKELSEMAQTGDMVEMYYEGSPSQDDALSGGKGNVITTHIGMVTEKDGKKYVTHNVHGTWQSEPLEKAFSPTKLKKGSRVMISGIVRPDWYDNNSSYETIGIGISDNARYYDKSSLNGRVLGETSWKTRPGENSPRPMQRGSQQFIRSMAAHAVDIQNDFGLNDVEMENMMRLGWGIFGKESGFLKGDTYVDKTKLRGIYDTYKDIAPDWLPEGDEMSAGPGQIKLKSFFNTPEKEALLAKYGINKDNIWDEKTSAVALMLTNAITYKELSNLTGLDFSNTDAVTLRNVLALAHNKGLKNLLLQDFSDKNASGLVDKLIGNEEYKMTVDSLLRGLGTYSNRHMDSNSYANLVADYAASLDLDYQKVKENSYNPSMFKAAVESIPNTIIDDKLEMADRAIGKIESQMNKVTSTAKNKARKVKRKIKRTIP